MKCSNCGWETSEEVKYCEECGIEHLEVLGKEVVEAYMNLLDDMKTNSIGMFNKPGRCSTSTSQCTLSTPRKRVSRTIRGC